MLPLSEKRITAEVCVHHLHFTSDDYAKLGNQIKCNPAIKAPHNRNALWAAMLDDRLDIIATDHAPHTMDEKGLYRNDEGCLTPKQGENGSYLKAHAGLPLVQHSLPLMLYYVNEGKLSMEKMVEKMSHAPALCFRVRERGFVREGYYADLVIVDTKLPARVSSGNILYKCGWSPMESCAKSGKPIEFPSSVTHTFVNGQLVYENGQFNESNNGMRLQFNR
jgi:dihydroorotase